MDGGLETDVKKELSILSKELDGPIRSYIHDEDPSILIEACRQYPNAGGKRMRPSLVITSCAAVGGKKEDAIPLAIAIEYIHNFTLIHDDLMDGDERRRGMETSHVKYGLSTAILAGDGLFAKAFDIISNMNIPSETIAKIMKVVSRAVWDLARGQQMDISNENEGANVTMERYIETIRLKTSVLFAAAVEGGAMVAGADDDVVKNLGEYASLMGLAFQMYDDILGIYGDPKKTGKSAGNDIRKGKSTVIVCHFMKNADAKMKKEFLSILGNADATDIEIEKARSILKESGSYDYALSLAEKHVNDAKSKLSCLKESKEKEFLISLADFAITRDV